MIQVENTEENRTLHKDERWVLKTPLFILIFDSKEEIGTYIIDYMKGDVDLPENLEEDWDIKYRNLYYSNNINNLNYLKYIWIK